MDIRAAIAAVTARHDLSEADMEAVLDAIMTGTASAAQTAALLVGLRMKGESIAEIVGAARAMRRHATPVVAAGDLLDTCGTGGDMRGTFNISTAAALIAAAAGLRVAKHGNRAMSGTVGAADVLEALGVRLDLAAPRIAACVETVGVGFLFAQALHPAMRHVAPVRRELGVRTIFNLLGPLTNPAGATRQLLGVFAREWVEPLAHALKRLGSRRALVVCGEDGLDELSLSAPSWVAELRDGAVHAYRFTPDEAGLAGCDAGELQGGDAAANAAILRAIVENRAAAAQRDVALLNAGAALYVGGAAERIGAGVELARAALDSGAAARTLDALIAFTRA